MKTSRKITSTLLFLLGFFLVSLTVHEFFHYVTVIALGGQAFVTYNILHGYTTWTADTNYIWLIQISGGLFTGIFFLVFFWLLPHLSVTKHDTNLEVSAFAFGIGNLFYAPSEVLMLNELVGAGIFLLGFTIAGILYIIKISSWMYNNGTQN